MGTGRRIEDSEGNDYKAWYRAVEAHLDDPTLRFYETWVEMSGIKQREVTDEVARRAQAW